MYRILIKTQPGHEDVEISAENITEFNMYADIFLNMTMDSTSPYYIDSCVVQAVVSVAASS